MVNRYLKALALTLLILIVGLAGINYLDSARINGISGSVEAEFLELEASRQLLRYEGLFDESLVCSALDKRVEAQKADALRVLTELQSAQANTLFGDTALLKKKYILNNIELYLLMKKSISSCGEGKVVPVLYFYPDKYYCAECAAQAKILDSAVSECKNIRVFAFPVDLDFPVIDLLQETHGVKGYPAVVVKDTVLSNDGRIVLKEDILTASGISCN